MNTDARNYMDATVCISKIDQELSKLGQQLDKNIGIIERKRLDDKLNQLLDVRSKMSKGEVLAE